MTRRYQFADPYNQVKDIFSPVSISQACNHNEYGGNKNTTKFYIIKKKVVCMLCTYIFHFPSVLILSTIRSLGKDDSNGNHHPLPENNNLIGWMRNQRRTVKKSWIDNE